MIECPECGAEIDVEEDELDEGESILCEECGRNFVVSSVDPLELEEDDDLDEDDEFDDDFDEEDDEEDDEDDDKDEDKEEEDDWH
jgi:lysine biosynthesis protein LysW